MSVHHRGPVYRKKLFSSDSKPHYPTPHVKEEPRTITWSELMEWQKDNEYILSGYRRIQNQWQGCLASIFSYLHNETVNIHTHLWGAFVFIYLLANIYPTHLNPISTTTWYDIGVFVIFLSSAVFCLLGSAFFHTSTCHSQKVFSRCRAFDYSGIVVMTVGSFYPSLYYGFFCEPYFQVLYIGLMSFAGLGAAYIVLNPEYAKPTHRGARTTVFLGLGSCAVVPVSHLLITHGSLKLLSEMGFEWTLVSGGLYIAGALLYANRIPERLFPGRFDYFLASHQIFHCFVVLAALSHYAGVLTALYFRHSQAQLCEI